MTLHTVVTELKGCPDRPRPQACGGWSGHLQKAAPDFCQDDVLWPREDTAGPERAGVSQHTTRCSDHTWPELS